MFSKACEYALRASVYLAQKSSLEKKWQVDDIAAAIDAPRSFTAKILQQLHRKKIICATKGRWGGFYLTDEMKGQPVWNILVAFGEETRVTGCVMGLHQCNDKEPCPLHVQYKVTRQQLVALFAASIHTIAEANANKSVFMRNA